MFWLEEDREVRRCTWYYKGDLDREYIPFSETHANRLEEEFQVAAKQNIWPRKVTSVIIQCVNFHNIHEPFALNCFVVCFIDRMYMEITFLQYM